MPAAQKLSHLLQLADQGPALRAALAEEVAELLIQWPPDYPAAMRGVCESLLARAAHDTDADTRARLRVLLYADPELASRVLPREVPARALVEALRRRDNVDEALARHLGVRPDMAQQILADESGAALAVACKGAGLDRAAFSALVLLSGPRRDAEHAHAVLDAYDNVPFGDATHVLRGWRGETPVEAHAA